MSIDGQKCVNCTNQSLYHSKIIIMNVNNGCFQALELSFLVYCCYYYCFSFSFFLLTIIIPFYLIVSFPTAFNHCNHRVSFDECNFVIRHGFQFEMKISAAYCIWLIFGTRLQLMVEVIYIFFRNYRSQRWMDEWKTIDFCLSLPIDECKTERHSWSLIDVTINF